MYENVCKSWSKGRLFSHLIKLAYLMVIDPSDGSVELEMIDTLDIVKGKYGFNEIQ